MVATNPLADAPVRGGNFYADGYCQTDVKRGVTRNRVGTRLLCLTTDFLVGFRRAIQDETGPSADLVFKTCGRKWGGFVAKRFDEEMAGFTGKSLRDLSLAQFQSHLVDMFAEHGWGKVRLDLTRHNQGLVVVSIEEPIYAAIAGKSDTPVESLTAGLLAGFFSAVFEQDLDCVQTRCVACGHTEATFLVALTSRLAGVPNLQKSGKGHEQILKELVNVRV
jgi:predicted hydrocarbon binding protein